MKVLEGIRVVEVADFSFVPCAGALLADWGADVVKIEQSYLPTLYACIPACILSSLLFLTLDGRLRAPPIRSHIFKQTKTES
jgi:hypothetical protein